MINLISKEAYNSLTDEKKIEYKKARCSEFTIDLFLYYKEPLKDKNMQFTMLATEIQNFVYNNWDTNELPSLYQYMINNFEGRQIPLVKDFKIIKHSKYSSGVNTIPSNHRCITCQRPAFQRGDNHFYCYDHYMDWYANKSPYNNKKDDLVIAF